MEYVEVARAVSERGEVVLRERHDPEPGDGAPATLELRVNGVFVMDTRETTTERELARAALARSDSPRTVLVGGLGLGFTLHELLADPRVERVVVVELEDALVRWMRDGTIPHGPAYLADARVHVQVADIRTAVAEATPGGYDLALLDVDNGPGFLVHDGNAEVYEEAFLRAVAGLLRPGGTVVVWSADRSEMLRARLADVFGDAEEQPHEVTLQGRAERYWLYLACR